VLENETSFNPIDSFLIENQLSNSVKRYRVDVDQLQISVKNPLNFKVNNSFFIF